MSFPPCPSVGFLSAPGSTSRILVDGSPPGPLGKHSGSARRALWLRQAEGRAGAKTAACADWVKGLHILLNSKALTLFLLWLHRTPRDEHIQAAADASAGLNVIPGLSMSFLAEKKTVLNVLGLLVVMAQRPSSRSDFILSWNSPHWPAEHVAPDLQWAVFSSQTQAGWSI